MNHASAITGYAEGYYGRVLTWAERSQLLQAIADSAGNVYLYAPKDDDYHRLHWRQPYPPVWRDQFRTFTATAGNLGIDVIAGISPGLDFDFSHMAGGADFRALSDKARQLLADGATAIAIMFDDIDANFEHRSGAFNSEGRAHAQLANRMVNELNAFSGAGDHHSSCVAVPRIYANELITGGDPDLSGDCLFDRNHQYLKDFLDQLSRNIPWFYCGKHIVAKQPRYDDLLEMGIDSKTIKQHRVIFWDNFYANDYCPRRLFLGPWLGRESCTDVLINPTGLLHTDQLLLQIVAACRHASLTDHERIQNWRACLQNASVPAIFQHIENYFLSPCFSPAVPENSMAENSMAANKDTKPQQFTEATDCLDLNDTEAGKAASGNLLQQQIEAVDQLLWRWKSPLAREWYPYLMGLKQDLLMANGELSDLRIRKTQLAPLAKLLTCNP